MLRTVRLETCNCAGTANLVEESEDLDLRFEFFRAGLDDGSDWRAASSTLPANCARAKAASPQ
jgi:hypothetical protein